jgi:hypothetical protein
VSENEQLALELSPATPWSRPKGKSTCGRDPDAGPGTCWHWWDGCPKAEKRGCYLLHMRKLREAQQ